jgi:DNA-binding transcriptional regulator LsrR (DeoR family)
MTSPKLKQVTKKMGMSQSKVEALLKRAVAHGKKATKKSK